MLTSSTKVEIVAPAFFPLLLVFIRHVMKSNQVWIFQSNVINMKSYDPDKTAQPFTTIFYADDFFTWPVDIFQAGRKILSAICAGKMIWRNGKNI